MTMPPIASAADVNLSDWEFWKRPMADREHSFQLLRDLDRPAFFEEPAVSFASQGLGYHALVRHADILEASRTPRSSAPATAARRTSSTCRRSSSSTSAR